MPLYWYLMKDVKIVGVFDANSAVFELQNNDNWDRHLAIR